MHGARRKKLEECQAGSLDVEDISKGPLKVTEIESEEIFDGGFEVWSDKCNHQEYSSTDYSSRLVRIKSYEDYHLGASLRGS
jgi:hypothetical protein